MRNSWQVPGQAERAGRGGAVVHAAWLGFCPEDVLAAPAAAVARLSERLGIAVGEVEGYGSRAQTRSEHLADVAVNLGWHQVDGPRWKDLEEFLLRGDGARLAEAAVPAGVRVSVLLPPCPPGRGAHPGARRDRAEAGAQGDVGTAEPMLTGFLRAELDGMLVPDPLLGRTRLAWLGTGPTTSTRRR